MDAKVVAFTHEVTHHQGNKVAKITKSVHCHFPPAGCFYIILAQLWSAGSGPSTSKQPGCPYLCQRPFIYDLITGNDNNSVHFCLYSSNRTKTVFVDS